MSLLLVYQVSDSEIFVVSDVAIIGFVVTDQAAVVALVVGVDAGGLGEVGSLNVPVAVRETITFDESAVANQQGGGFAISDTDGEALAESITILVPVSFTDAEVLGEVIAGILPLVAVDVGGMAEQPNPNGSIAVGDAVAIDESAQAQQTAFGAITDVDAFTVDEVVIEPVPPIGGAPPIFGGGLGRKRSMEKPPRWLQRRPIGRDWFTVNESAVAELQEPFTQEFRVPWEPDQEEEETMILMALLADA